MFCEDNTFGSYMHTHTSRASYSANPQLIPPLSSYHSGAINPFILSPPNSDF